MATNRWRGDAANVSQITTLTVGSATNTEMFTTTINTKVITYTAGAAETTSTVATAIQALLAASNIPEFQEITWTVASAVVTGTASTPGVPFAVTAGGTGTYTAATPTASKGSSDASTLANWSAGTLPAAAEDILIDSGADILYGLGGITPAIYASFKVKASFTGQIGLPYWNPAGYVEYRTRYYPVATTSPIKIGEGDGAGPTRVYISSGLVLDLTVFATGVRQESVPVVNVYGCTSGVVSVVSGDVGIAADDDTQTATVTTATVNDGATYTVGTGATTTTLNQDGAVVLSFGTVTTLTQYSGTTTLYAAPTTITADGGKVIGYYTGTTTTATFRGQGNPQTDPVLDFSNDTRARTITNGSFTGGSSLLDPDKTTVWSNAQTWDSASLALSQLGPRFSLTRT